MPDKFQEWQCPAQAANEERRLGWVNEATEEGQNWLKSQRGYDDFQRAMDVLAGRPDPLESVRYRSKVNSFRLKKNIREVVECLANIRPLWGYHSENPAFAEHAGMMNKVSRALYLEQFFDRSLKEALQYAAATCTGWVRPVYRRNQAGKGKGNIQLLTYGSPCVIPVQMPSSNDWQEAYAVTLLDEMPIFMAHSYFPDFQDRLTPTHSRYWYSAEIHKAASGNMWKRMFGGMFKRKEQEMLSDLYVPVRYTYVNDLTINKTGSKIPMGEPGAPWYYEVPSLNEMVPAGADGNGLPLYRSATANDARLYPFRRLIISSENCIMYDGPAFDWHGELPLIPFCVDDWPWEAIGFSLVRDGYELQKAITRIDQGVMDKIGAQLDLPLGYDINAVSKREAVQFDPMQPRARVGFDGSQVERPFVPVVPPEVYDVRPEILAVRQQFMNDMDYQIGIRDIVALAKARAVGRDSDQLEALMEANGPVVRGISRSMERSLCRVGQQLKYLILEYMDTARLMQYVGEDGVSREIFDYDPRTLVPSHLPAEIPTDGADMPQNSSYTKLERARWFADNLRFFLLPHSIHEITQMTHRLMLLQMRQRGAPIDWRTIAEACDVPNFGTKPEGNTAYERYWNEQEDMVLHALRIKRIAEMEQAGDILGMLQPKASGSNPVTGGRPPTAQSAPRIETKDGGTRTTITESR